MCDTTIIYRAGQVIGTCTWTEGFTKCVPPDQKLDDNKVQAWCLYLEKHDRPEEAEELLEWWCETQSHARFGC